MNRGRGIAATRPDADAVRLLHAFGRALDDQPSTLTRRFGIVNLSWVAVEALGPTRGPETLEALIAGGYLRRHPRNTEIGRLTPAGTRTLVKAQPAAA